MLRTLLESQAVPNRRAGGTVISVAVHTGVIALAIAATARATIAPPNLGEKPVVIAVTPPPRKTDPPPIHTDATSSGGAVGPVIENVLVPPVKVPDHLPIVDLTHPPTGDDFCAACARAALAIGVQGATGLTSPTGLYTAVTVEKAAAPQPGNPSPVYPPALRAAQLEGAVVARFVVDTTGLAEPATITFTETTRAQFAEAVRQALLRSRYLPATIGGRKVRQLVEQRFAFTLVR